MRLLFSFCMMLSVGLCVAGDNGTAEVDKTQIKILLAKPFLKAEFIKTRTLKIMSRPFITSGKVLFLPDKGLIWETTQPVRDVLFISQKGVSQLDINTNKIVNIDNPIVKSASEVFVSIVSLDLNKINRLFDIKLLNSESGVHRYSLTPKDDNLKKAILSLEIRGRSRVEAILIREVGGDSTEVIFKDEQFDMDAFSPAELTLFKLM